MEIHTFYPSRGPNSQRRFRNESLTMGSIGYITCHAIQKQAASQSCDGLLKAQLRHHCGGDTLQKWDIVYSSNQRPPYVVYIHNRKYTQVQEQRSRSRSGPIYHYCQRPRGGLCASHPWNSGFCRARGPTPQREHTFQWTWHGSHQTGPQLLSGHSGLVFRKQQASGTIMWWTLQVETFPRVYLMSAGVRLEN